jgi:hypothetical protein
MHKRSLFACLNSLVIMTDVPTSASRTLIDVEQVGMFLFSHLRCRFQVLQLLMGRFLARKDEFATPFAVRSAVAPQRPPLRQTLYVPFSHRFCVVVFGVGGPSVSGVVEKNI